MVFSSKLDLVDTKDGISTLPSPPPSRKHQLVPGDIGVPGSTTLPPSHHHQHHRAPNPPRASLRGRLARSLGCWSLPFISTRCLFTCEPSAVHRSPSRLSRRSGPSGDCENNEQYQGWHVLETGSSRTRGFPRQRYFHGFWVWLQKLSHVCALGQLHNTKVKLTQTGVNPIIIRGRVQEVGWVKHHRQHPIKIYLK